MLPTTLKIFCIFFLNNILFNTFTYFSVNYCTDVVFWSFTLQIFLSQFSKKFGPVFSIKFFGPRIAVINGLKHVREVYQADSFADRPIIPIITDTVGDKGDLSISTESYYLIHPMINTVTCSQCYKVICFVHLLRSGGVKWICLETTKEVCNPHSEKFWFGQKKP